MIVRSTIRCAATLRLQVCRRRTLQAGQRGYSSSTSSSLANSPGSSTSPASMLGAFTNELDRIAPRFEIQGSQITVLRSPSEFYEALKVRSIIIPRQEGYVLMEVGQDPWSGESHLSVYFVHRKNRK